MIEYRLGRPPLSHQRNVLKGHLTTGALSQAIHKAEELGHEAYDALTSEKAQKAYKETGNWVVHTWCEVIAPALEKAGRTTSELVWRVTDDVLTGSNIKRGEPDVLLVQWRRCRRCQSQFDPDRPSDTKCVWHPARFECLHGTAPPFKIKHRDTSKCETETCEGRFPCCGKFFKLDSADSNGCKENEKHYA